MNWFGKTADRRFAVDLQHDVLSVIDDHCHDAELSSVGGILIGRHCDVNACAIALEAIPVLTGSASEINCLQMLLNDRWKAERRTFYLGEWRFRPTGITEPSDDDLEQMFKISRNDSDQCPDALITIFSNRITDERLRPLRVFIFSSNGTYREFISKR